MNLALVARRLAEDTMGGILPTHLEEMTISQILCLTLPKSALGGPDTISVRRAVAMGLIPPQEARSKAQIMRADAEARKRQDAKAGRRKRRRARA